MPLFHLDDQAPQRSAIAQQFGAAGVAVTPIDSCEQALASVPFGATVLVDLGTAEALATVPVLVELHGATVIALCAEEPRPSVMAAIRAGACGFVRTSTDILPAVQVVLDGRIWLPPAINERRGPDRPGYGTWIPAPREPGEAGLSPRQAMLLRLWVEGKPAARIAVALATSEAELAIEQAALQRQFDAPSRLQLVLNLARTGLRLGLGGFPVQGP